MALNIGIPPATEASNSRLTLFFSESLAKSFPCFDIKALLGVITCILFFKAVSTIFLKYHPTDLLLQIKYLLFFY